MPGSGASFGGGGSAPSGGGAGMGNAQMAFLDTWFQLAGELAASKAEATAERNLTKANQFSRNMRRIDALQKRRAFMAAAREVRAQVSVAGQVSGAGLESSAAQGNRASLQTQAEVGLSQQAEVFAFNERKIRAIDRAKRHAAAGASLRQLGKDII